MFNKESNMKGNTGVLTFIFDGAVSNMKVSIPVLPFIFDFLLNKSGPFEKYRQNLFYFCLRPRFVQQEIEYEG